MSVLGLWGYFVGALLITGVLMVFVKRFLGIKIVSASKNGEVIYHAIDGAIGAGLGYLALSSIAGHFLQ